MLLINKNYIKDGLTEVLLNFDDYSIKVPVAQIEILNIGEVVKQNDGTCVANELEILFRNNTWYSDYISLYSELREKNLKSIDLIGKNVEVENLYIPYEANSKMDLYNKYMLYRLEGNELFIRIKK